MFFSILIYMNLYVLTMFFNLIFYKTKIKCNNINLLMD